MPSNSQNKRVIHNVSIGEPPQKKPRVAETIRCVIHNFKEQNGSLNSPIVTVHGYKWRLYVETHGVPEDDTTEYVGCYLELCQPRNVDVEFDFMCQTYIISSTKSFTHDGCRTWGSNNFLTRDDAIQNRLEKDGSLVIECILRITSKPIWYPTLCSPHARYVNIYGGKCSESLMVGFSIGDKTYPVHKSILSVRCKGLYEIAKDCDDGSPIPIESVREDIFKFLLDFVHNEKEVSFSNKDSAVEMLVAADRYDCTLLKLYVESYLVGVFLKDETAAEMLLLGHSHTCPLLKEEAMEFFLADNEIAKKAEAWSKIQDSKELLLEMFNSLQRSNKKKGEHDPHDINLWDVGSLRNALQENNLELDGSRKMLIDRLNDHREKIASKSDREKIVSTSD